MSLTGLICSCLHTVMFFYAFTCTLYLLKEFVPEDFIPIEAIKNKLWDSTLKPFCTMVVQLITDLFQDHYKDFSFSPKILNTLDLNKLLPLSVSTLAEPVFVLSSKIYSSFGQLASQIYRWITLEKFVYVYPVAFWVISFFYSVLTRHWKSPLDEEGDEAEEDSEDKSGDEGDDEDSEDDDEDEGDNNSNNNQSDTNNYEDDYYSFLKRKMRRISRRRNRIRQEAERIRNRGPVSKVNNVGPMHNSRRFDDRLCSICYENERNAVLLPCGHTNLCLLCAYNYNDINKTCPFCQISVETIHKIFL